MSRLYYPPVVGSRLASGTATAQEAAQDTLEKVAKLIPAELITGYSGLISLSANFQNSIARNVGFLLSFLLCGTLTSVYLNKMAEAGKPKTIHLIESTAAFVVWAYFTSGRQVIPEFFSSTVAMILLLLFTLVSATISPNK